MTEKQRVSAWDILEGHKNPVPLSWAWFGAVRLERKPLWYEENHRLLKYHTHSLVKPSSYFLEPLPLPPEDMEPPTEKPVSFTLIYGDKFVYKLMRILIFWNTFKTHQLRRKCITIE